MRGRSGSPRKLKSHYMLLIGFLPFFGSSYLCSAKEFELNHVDGLAGKGRVLSVVYIVILLSRQQL